MSRDKATGDALLSDPGLLATLAKAERFLSMSARLSPFTYQRPVRVGKVYELTDPTQPGQTFEFFLAPHDEESEQEALELGFEMIAKYIDGDEIEDLPPMDFPAVGGRPVKLTKIMCQQAASLCGLQMKQKGKPDPYTFEEMIGISLTTPTLWRALQKIAVGFRKKSKKSEKNDSGESAETASDSPSAS